jgi:hypothetical protein
MSRPQYQQRCIRCRKNMVLVTSRERFPLCYDCQKNDLQGEVKDPAMQKLFAIPEEYYKKNAFLRDIKIQYLRFGKLSEKQIDAFKKAVDKLTST